MPETSPAQGTLKRLIAAEEEARQILKTAEESAQEIVDRTREQAAQIVEAARQETADALLARTSEAEAQAATEMKHRLEQAEAAARDVERRAAEHFVDAVDFVVGWVSNRSE